MNILAQPLGIALLLGGLTGAALAHPTSSQSSRIASAPATAPSAAKSPEAMKAYWDKVLFRSR